MLGHITPPLDWSFSCNSTPQVVLFPAYLHLSLSSHCPNVWMRWSSWRTLTWWWPEPTNWPSSRATARRSKPTVIQIIVSGLLSPQSVSDLFYFHLKSLSIPKQVLESRRSFRRSRVRTRRRQIRATVRCWRRHRWWDQESHVQEWVTRVLRCELAINLTRLLLWFLNPKTVPELTFDYFL